MSYTNGNVLGRPKTLVAQAALQGVSAANGYWIRGLGGGHKYEETRYSATVFLYLALPGLVHTASHDSCYNLTRVLGEHVDYIAPTVDLVRVRFTDQPSFRSAVVQGEHAISSNILDLAIRCHQLFPPRHPTPPKKLNFV